MDLLRVLWKRLSGSVRRAPESDMDEELRFHLEMEIEENRRRGMSAEQARDAAMKRFGSLAAAKESYRDSFGLPLLEDFWRDLRYACRGLLRSPAFSVFVVLSLALGVGANTAIFGVFDAAILRTLPLPEPERLVLLGIASKSGTTPAFSHVLYRELRESTSSVADMAASSWNRSMDLQHLQSGSADMAGSDDRASFQMVSGNYFRVASIPPAAGRLFDEHDDVATDMHPVAVISDHYWNRRFQRSPSAIGAQFRLNQTVFTIVGVAAAGFDGFVPGESPEVWVPIRMQKALDPSRDRLNNRNTSWVTLMARLEGDATMQQLEDRLSAQFQVSLLEEAKQSRSKESRAELMAQRITVEPGARGLGQLREQLSDPLTILFGLSMLVLLVACSNVASLILARSLARQRELAVRNSLGASRWRVVRQLLTESSILVAVGTVVGWMFSLGVTAWMLQAMERVAGVQLRVQTDLRMFGFTVMASAFMLILVGVIPALRISWTGFGVTLNGGGRTTTSSRSHLLLRKALVLIQIAASMMLLVGATLLTRSLYNLSHVETGFSPENTLIVNVNPTGAAYAPPSGKGADRAAVTQLELRLRRLYDKMEESLRSQPGVQSVAFADCGYFNDCEGARCCMLIPGVSLKSENEKRILTDEVSADFFSVSGIAIVAGRGFTEAETQDKQPNVAVINQTAARELFGDDTAIDRQIHWEGESDRPLRIVGVAADAKHADLRQKTVPFLYTPFVRDRSLAASMYIRTHGEAAGIIDPVRRAIQQVEPELQIRRWKTVQQGLDQALIRERIVSELCTAFTVLALLLAATGLYSIMAFQVLQRRNEFGIRLALGAPRQQVLWKVLRESVLLGVVGVTVGCIVVYAAAQSLTSLLYGVSAWDPLSFAISALFIGAIVVVAGYIPARRAASTDPMVALRCD